MLVKKEFIYKEVSAVMKVLWDNLPSPDVSLVLGMTSKPVVVDLRVWAGV